MKTRIAVLAALALVASATTAGSATAPQPQFKRIADLSDCQLAELARCYAKWGDYVMCYEQAEQYAC